MPALPGPLPASAGRAGLGGGQRESVECTEEEIDEFCKKLPRYKRPRKLIFAKVPRNPTGKIEKPKLREKYGAAHLVAAQNQVEIK